MTRLRSLTPTTRVLLAVATLNYAAVLFLPPTVFAWGVVVLLILDLCGACGWLGALYLREQKRADVAELALAVEQNHRARKARDAAAVVSPMLREGKGTRLHAVPAQREPLVVADDRWWESLYDEKGERRG